MFASTFKARISASLRLLASKVKATTTVSRLCEVFQQILQDKENNAQIVHWRAGITHGKPG